MKLFDISMEISEETISYPGDRKFSINKVSSLEKGNQVNLSEIHMNVHTGTHLDAPFHYIQKSDTISDINPNRFFGKAKVFDFTDLEMGTGITDTELDNETILKYYSKRWPIETFFRQTKNNLGLNTYQVRSTKSIDRLLVLISLTYIYCSSLEKANNSFSKGLLICRNEVKKDNIQWIYECAKNNVAIETVFKTMKVA